MFSLCLRQRKLSPSRIVFQQNCPIQDWFRYLPYLLGSEESARKELFFKQLLHPKLVQRAFLSLLGSREFARQEMCLNKLPHPRRFQLCFRCVLGSE